jgi:putative methanogenesis marker protein 12
MFIGVDHGTRAIRFATSEGRCFELPRMEASQLLPQSILEMVERNLGKPDLVALTYSMGDGLTKIMRIEDAPNRGLARLDGAGLHVGGGTRVFEAMRNSGWPCILLPGIHRGSGIDPRLKVFSHAMSPEKVGLAYYVWRGGDLSFIISDASSNTVTLAVLEGRIVGGIDAPIFAPGLLQGPLDVEAIRSVDSGLMSANEAFHRGGFLPKMSRGSLEECTHGEREQALEALALFAAMEIGALGVLLKDLGEARAALYLAGDPATLLAGRVSQLLGREVLALARCAAAQGCAKVAQAVYGGAQSILGIEVDRRARSLGRV